jgi:hypothetical protein
LGGMRSRAAGLTSAVTFKLRMQGDFGVDQMCPAISRSHRRHGTFLKTRH